ncbi:MAG: hypothetical protein ACLRZH_07435 [Ruthenibacterium lactatiformans]
MPTMPACMVCRSNDVDILHSCKVFIRQSGTPSAGRPSWRAD